jgi:hypothetical protein
MAAYVTYGRVQRRAAHAGRWVVMGVAAVALFGLAACNKAGVGGGSDEMGWARAALERNDRIEIVATDPSTSTFTVRVKDTGELRTVRTDQIIAAPAGLTAPAGAAAPAGTAAPSEPAPGDSTTASNTEQPHLRRRLPTPRPVRRFPVRVCSSRRRRPRKPPIPTVT